MAMKCLAPLASFVADDYAVYLVDKLLEPVVDSGNQGLTQSSASSINIKSMRDVAFLGLKAILAELSSKDSKSATIARSNVPKILYAINDNSKLPEVHIEALELLNELLKKMGAQFPNRHEEAMRALFLKLDSQSAVVRKRAIACLGSLGVVCNASIFQDIMSVTIDNLTSSSSDLKKRTGVQAIWALARTSGGRLGSYLDIVVPIFFEFCTREIYENDDDLREHCLQAMDSFCTLCRQEMVPFIEKLRDCVVVLAKHDPNYALDSDDEDDGNSDAEVMTDADAEDDDAFLDYDDDDFSDDDDASWKVRRAAIRCIHAVITAKLLPPHALYSSFGLFLVSRFKERAENVKLDAFAAFISLLQAHNGTVNADVPSVSMDISDMNNSMEVSPAIGVAMDLDMAEATDMAPLLERAIHIVRIVRKELGSNSMKTRVKAMSVLCELISRAPQTFVPLFGKLVSEIERALAEESAQLKSETLRCLKGVVVGGGSVAMKDFIQQLIPKILAAAEDRYYKITAESLRLCSSCIYAFGGTSSDDCKNAMRPLSSSIYDAAEKRITAMDQDSEVKEAALECLGNVVSYFGQDLGSERLSRVGSTLCSRLKNEVTRLASVRAMLQISQSDMNSVFRPVSGTLTKTVISLLRKNNTALRAASLELLACIPELEQDGDTELLTNVRNLINDGDLKLSHLALRLCSNMIKRRGSGVSHDLANEGSVYWRVLELAVSPLLQGRVVTSLLNFFKELAIVNVVPLSVERIVKDLHGLANSVDTSMVQVTSRSSPLHTISKCLAVVCTGADASFCSRTASALVVNITADDSKTCVFALVCLGEFGKRSLLNKSTDEQATVQQAMLEVLDSDVIEVRTAAALALGGLASASGSDGIPALVELIHERPQIRYLLLLSLKDAIALSPINHVTSSIEVLLPLLLNTIPESHAGNISTDSQESSGVESIRIATSECLGLLMQAVPQQVISVLRQSVSSPNADVRASVAAAVRFAVSTNFAGMAVANSLVTELEPALPEFVGLIADPDVLVSKNALQAVQAIARSRHGLLSPLLNQILGLVFDKTAKNPHLVRVVDLGPFQHEEDFGLDLRKASFGIMRTLIDSPLAYQVPMDTFIEKVVGGLGDQQDVRAIAQLILIAIASSPFGAQIVDAIDSIIKALEKTLSERVKENAVRQEIERYEESIRGALRTIRMIEMVPEVHSSASFQKFMSSTVQRKFAQQYRAVSEEANMLTVGVSGASDGSMAGDRDQMRD